MIDDEIGIVNRIVDAERSGVKPLPSLNKYFARRPPAVFNYLIKKYSSEGDIILDPFLG
jgi:DNA modification methylase